MKEIKVTIVFTDGTQAERTVMVESSKDLLVNGPIGPLFQFPDKTVEKVIIPEDDFTKAMEEAALKSLKNFG